MRPGPGPHLNPVLLQPWLRLLTVVPKTSSGLSLYWALGRREDLAPAPPLVLMAIPSALPHRASAPGQNQPGNGSPRVAVATFPKVTFCPHMSRPLRLSSQGLEEMFKRELFSYLQGSVHVASSPGMAPLPTCSLHEP